MATPHPPWLMVTRPQPERNLPTTRRRRRCRIALAGSGADRWRAGAARRRARRRSPALGVTDVPLVAIAKGPDRDAGRETFFMPGRDRSSCRRAIRCFISSSGCATRRIDSRSARTAHGASATSARPACRKSPASARPASARCCITSARSRRSSAPRVTDLTQVPGISAETARRIYDFFHEGAA